LIHIRSKREIERIRKSCAIVAGALKLAESLVKPGVETRQIDRHLEEFIVAQGAKPAFKGYRGFPASSCISVEDEVVHGIPGKRKLEEGQIVSVDIGAELDGFFGDSARTFAVGEISEARARLMQVTQESLAKGLREVKAGARLSNVSHAIQQEVEGANFSVVRELVGHGIGRDLHEDPQIPNYGAPNSGPRLRAGMVLAIEPMVNMGTFEVRTLGDNWTVVTLDGMPSAHFEHTVVVADGGAEILTVYN